VENFSFLLWAISFWFRHWKNFKNRPTFTKVTVKIKVAVFLTQCIFKTFHVLGLGPLGVHYYYVTHNTVFLDTESLITMTTRLVETWEASSDVCWLVDSLYNVPLNNVNGLSRLTTTSKGLGWPIRKFLNPDSESQFWINPSLSNWIEFEWLIRIWIESRSFAGP